MWHGVPFACQRRPIIGVLRMCWLLPGSFGCFCCPHTSVHRPSIACLAVFLCGRGALFLHALSGPSTICPFPPHGWSAPDGLPLLLRKQPSGRHPPPDAGGAGVALAPGSDGAGWPSHPLYCRCLPCARSTIRSILVPCSRRSGGLSCLAVPVLLVWCARPCPPWCGSCVLCVCVAPPPVWWRCWVPMSRTPSCPTRLPPRTRIPPPPNREGPAAPTPAATDHAPPGPTSGTPPAGHGNRPRQSDQCLSGGPASARDVVGGETWAATAPKHQIGCVAPQPLAGPFRCRNAAFEAPRHS